MEDKKESPFITRLELINSLVNQEKELTQKINVVDKKVNEVDRKTDDLKDILLPLAEFSKQTAENTKKMSEEMTAFTREQRKTNGDLWSKTNRNTVALAELGKTVSSDVETKKAKATVISAIIAAISAIIVAMFGIAHLIF